MTITSSAETKTMPSSVLRSRCTTLHRRAARGRAARRRFPPPPSRRACVPACRPISVTIGSIALRRTWRAHDARLAEALGARGAHEVERQHLEHRGAHDAQVDRQEDQPQRQRRQHQVPRDVQHAPRFPCRLGADRVEAAGRQPVQIDAEQHDRHQAEPEGRRGVEHQPEGGDQRVRPSVDAPRRHHAEHQPEEEGEGQRRRHQQQRRRQPFQDDGRDRLAIDGGEAEVERRQPREVPPSCAGTPTSSP